MAPRFGCSRSFLLLPLSMYSSSSGGRLARLKAERTATWPDRLGSATALANGSGEIGTTYTYDPFGASTEGGETSDNPFQFTGRENDGTDLQYNRARYYSPSFGRFISRDPAGFEGSGANLYWYVNDNPLDFTDPSGECVVCIPSFNPIAPLEDAADQIGDWVSDAPGVVSDIFGGECGTSFGDRALSNFITTNTSIPGLIAPTLSGGAINNWGGVAGKYGTKTPTQWILRSRSLGELPAVSRAAAISWLYASGAWEAGVGLGSLLRSGISGLYC